MTTDTGYGSNGQILILEDNEPFGLLIKDQLTEAGFAVDLVNSVSSAVGSMSAKVYDLVIADLLIKDEDTYAAEGGLTLIHKVRAQSFERGEKIPVIAISGSTRSPGMERSLATARRMGADAALAKPFQPTAMLSTVHRLMNVHSEF